MSAKARVLGLTVDHKLTWDAHLMDVKKRFANKLDLLKRSRFLPKSVLRDFYFKVIILKIDQSVERPWHRLSMRVACSYSSAPGCDSTF